MRIVGRSEKGTSLVEILIALSITAIVFTGLVQASIMAASKNVENLLRNEAVTIAEQRMNEARNLPFDTLTGASDGGINVFRSFRGQPSFRFVRTTTVNALNTNNNQVQITVTWTWKNTQLQHRITSLVRRPGSL